MGIQGLLPFLKKIHEPVNVSKFSGCTVAIDSYCWLHKGAFSCAEKLALGEKTDQYVYYCIKFINYLLSKNIKPIMVFDGCHLPSKKAVETTRREKRELNRKKAAQFLREGRRAEARECLQKCIDISPEMALELMNVCRDKGVDCIVAPYEADSQLAYLNKIGVAQVIITEDSDLLLFGCERVIFKMDHAGNGILIEQKRLNEVLDIPSTQYVFEKFRYTCILSGCDYLPSLPGIGLARSTKVFKVARQADIKQLLKKLSTYLKSNITVPDEYIQGFVAADNTFLYQLVYDPIRCKLVPLTPYPSDLGPGDMPYAGAQIPENKALQIALGNINIYTGDKFAHFDPKTFVPKYVKKQPEMLHMRSIWDRNYRIRSRLPLHEPQREVERPNLHGKEVQVKAVRRSPRKRLREEDDPKEVKTNSELSQLYSIESPVTKRLRPDIDEDLQRFMFTAHVPEVKEEDSPYFPGPETPTNTGPSDSPKFFISLSDAHPEVEVPREEGEEEKGEEEEKENSPEALLKSPRRNVFASKSPAKRPRFNLNAAKPAQIKSRFFASSLKSLQKPAAAAESKCTNSNTTVTEATLPPSGSSDNVNCAYKPVHSNSANRYNTTGTPTSSSLSPKKTVSQKFAFSKTKHQSPSPQSAFNWSKFKFAKSQSSEDVTSVVQEQIRKTESAVQLRDKGNDCDGKNDSNYDGLPPFDSQDSSKEMTRCGDSYPYSIDSMCLENDSQQLGSQSQQSCDFPSQGNNDNSTKSPNNSNKGLVSQPKGLSLYFKTSTEKSATEYESDGITVDAVKEVNNGPPLPAIVIDSDEDDTKPSSSQSSTRSQGSTKPGCRVSGLSKRSKKPSSKSVSTDGKQKNLKDMFLNFSYNKSSVSKLSHNVD